MKRKSATGRSSTWSKSTGYPVVVKHIILYKATAFLTILFFFSSGINKDTFSTPKPSDFYHFNSNRVAAELEPAKGVIFLCPPVIPKKLIVDFASDTHLYPVVPEDHGLYNFYDNILKNEIPRINNVYGKTCHIKQIKLRRVDKEYLTNYTNSRFFSVHHVNP